MKAAEIAQTAGQLVSSTKAEEHGEMLANLNSIAAMWNGYLLAKTGKVPYVLDAEDVANMLEALKIARRCNGAFNLDDYVDGAGYAAIAGELGQRLRGMAA